MQEKIKNQDGQIVSYVTQITTEKGNTYTLYSDGKLYEEVDGKGFIPLNNLSISNRKIIFELMKRLKPAKTDVIQTRKKPKKRKIIEIDETPEL